MSKLSQSARHREQHDGWTKILIPGEFCFASSGDVDMFRKVEILGRVKTKSFNKLHTLVLCFDRGVSIRFTAGLRSGRI